MFAAQRSWAINASEYRFLTDNPCGSSDCYRMSPRWARTEPKQGRDTSARILLGMRIGSLAVSVWAVAVCVACQATPSAPLRVVSSAPAQSVERATVVAPAAWPPPAALTRGEYEQHLSEASARCEQFDLGPLDGHWIVVDSRPYPAVGEVWMCDGHIRWRGETGRTSDIA
jgi:hypothetical protein